jgi:hypothetical protein
MAFPERVIHRPFWPPNKQPLYQHDVNSAQLYTILDEVFPANDSSLIKHLLPESRTHQIQLPAYNPNIDYQSDFASLSCNIRQNLSLLKKNCFELNWFQEWVDLQDNIPESSECSSESGNNQGRSSKKNRTRRLQSQKDDLYKCPFQNCEKTYLSKTSLRLHIRRLHTRGSAMKDNENLQEPEFEPILRGVKLSRVFKSEHISKLKCHGGFQIDEVDSTKKVKDASDENKLESDASDNMIPQQYFFIYPNRK